MRSAHVVSLTASVNTGSGRTGAGLWMGTTTLGLERGPVRSLPGRPALLPALPVRDRLLEAPGGVSHFPGQIGHGNHGMSFARVLSGLGINPRLITQLWELRIWCHPRGKCSPFTFPKVRPNIR